MKTLSSCRKPITLFHTATHFTKKVIKNYSGVQNIQKYLMVWSYDSR